MKPKSLHSAKILLALALSLLNCLSAAAQTGRTNTANSYLERGNEWVAKGEYARAESDFTLAIATDPSQANTYYSCYAVRKLVFRLTVFFAPEAQGSLAGGGARRATTGTASLLLPSPGGVPDQHSSVALSGLAGAPGLAGGSAPRSTTG